MDNPAYAPDDSLYRYSDIGAIGFDLWQVCATIHLEMNFQFFWEINQIILTNKLNK